MENIVHLWASETADKMEVGVETATSLELYKAGGWGRGALLWGGIPLCRHSSLIFFKKSYKGSCQYN